MREVYLLNLSESTTSIPLYERLPVTVGGREVNKVQYKNLRPGEELVVGCDIDSAKRRYYMQFKAIMIDLRFRFKEEPKEGKQEEPKDPLVDETSTPENKGDETSTSEDKGDKVLYEEDSLKKMRQAELIAIAIKLGLEATTQDSKATIIEKIMGATVV